MEDKYISVGAHESALAREDRKNKRLWILVIILLCMLFGTNAGWIYYENQFEDVVTTVSQEAQSEGGDAVLYGDRAGAVFYGESEASSYDQTEETQDGR